LAGEEDPLSTLKPGGFGPFDALEVWLSKGPTAVKDTDVIPESAVGPSGVRPRWDGHYPRCETMEKIYPRINLRCLADLIRDGPQAFI
jgi:hypothetical protein